MRFKHVFIAVFVGTALIVAAFLVNRHRPAHQVDQPNAEFGKAVGKCAECHGRETGSVVRQFEMSKHAARFVAPLSYTGLGLLLILNRIDHEHWGRWVLFLAFSGFVGNFGLLLLDLAQNGFFEAAE